MRFLAKLSSVIVESKSKRQWERINLQTESAVKNEEGATGKGKNWLKWLSIYLQKTGTGNQQSPASDETEEKEANSE